MQLHYIFHFICNNSNFGYQRKINTIACFLTETYCLLVFWMFDQVVYSIIKYMYSTIRFQLSKNKINVVTFWNMLLLYRITRYNGMVECFFFSLFLFRYYIELLVTEFTECLPMSAHDIAIGWIANTKLYVCIFSSIRHNVACLA